MAVEFPPVLLFESSPPPPPLTFPAQIHVKSNIQSTRNGFLHAMSSTCNLLCRKVLGRVCVFCSQALESLAINQMTTKILSCMLLSSTRG